MILEIVRGFMGAGIITDSGIKMPIGNMIFNVGDPVYTDGEYAFGHTPERGKFINFSFITSKTYKVLKLPAPRAFITKSLLKFNFAIFLQVFFYLVKIDRFSNKTFS